MKNIIIVYTGELSKCPPAISIAHFIKNMNLNVAVISLRISAQTEKGFSQSHIESISLDSRMDGELPLLKRAMNRLRIRKAMWDTIHERYDGDTMLWLISDTTVKYLGSRIKNYRYVLHFLELSEYIPYYVFLPALKINVHSLCEKAERVVHAEYNRAHICKAWWGLSRLPEVLPNKPFIQGDGWTGIPGDINKKVKTVLKEVGDRKIILYQGIVSPERPLDAFMEAAKRLGDDYVFVLMSGDNDPYPDAGGRHYIFVPFIDPPYHLLLTRHAYIGVLSYTPSKNIYSPLNALYCAPNKVFEYSRFGIPMVGNDVPGLSYLFETQGCGVIVRELSPECIVQSIGELEEHYSRFSSCSRKFYDSVDMTAIIRRILGGKGAI